MSTNGNDPYIEFKAGDLIAAEVMNDMQCQIREDIGQQTQTAVENITQVPSSVDAEKLEGQSLRDITQAIIDQALSQMALQSGYVRLFKKLKVDEEVIIEHNLKNAPLVDAYQLEYFQVVASEDDYKFTTFVNFFLYHSSEKRIRFVPEDGGRPESVEIEPSDGEPYRVAFKDLLAHYNVDYRDSSSLGEIETELWDAIFAAPNDRFDDNQYTHSPWFDRCCREERTVKSLKQKGDWDDLWIKFVPRKTINYPIGLDDNRPEARPAPTQIEVSHFDWNRAGIKLLSEPVYPDRLLEMLQAEGRDITQELKVMLLLRA